MNTPKYSPERDFLDAMSVLVQKAIDVSTKIYGCVVVSVDTAQKIASVKINGKVNDVQYYGTAPTTGNVYRVFVPQNDMSRAFIITGESNGGGGTGAVDSVNGKTGDVVITKSDIGLSNVDNTKQYSASNPPPYPVKSVNNKTGAVTLNASDVNALPDTTVIPDKTSQLDNDSGYITNSALTDYAKKTEIPTKTSQLNNDSGFITEIPIATSSSIGGVKPVNKTSTMTYAVGIDVDGKLYTSPSDGASVFLVTLTTSEYIIGYHGDVTADKTFAEILAAYQSGNVVLAKWGNFSLRLVEIEEGASAYFSTFEGASDVQVEIYNVTAYCTNGNDWELGYWQNEIPFASDAIPKAPGIAKAGILGEFARGDHVHPKQTVTKSDVGLGNVDNVSVNTRLNRTTNVNAADTNYTTLMARGESLNAAEVTPAVNGAIAWVYG